MIKQLSIQNFQSHDNTTLDLHSGVNVIVGCSDSGKTAIIRALRWVVQNRPQGEAFRSTWGGETRVTVKLENSTVERVKDRENMYVLNGREFKAIKTEVPDEVIRALNFNEINAQYQFDRPFLLDDSPGEVAAHFNRVAHLDEIDAGLRNVQQWIRRTQQDIDTDNARLAELTELLKQFETLDTFEAKVAALEQMDFQRTKRQQRQSQLSRMLTDIATADRQIAEYEQITQHEDLVCNVLDLVARRKTLVVQRDTLNGKVGKDRELRQQLAQFDAVIGAEEAVNRVLAVFEQRAKVNARLTQINRVLGQLERFNADLNAAEREATRLETVFHENMPKVCPLCEQEIT
jgi:exonuclease SbcC